MEDTFEIEASPKIKLKYEGKELELEYPSQYHMIEFLQMSERAQEGKAKPSEMIEVTTKYLGNLGMPKDILKKLSLDQSTKVLEFIHGKIQKKS